MKFPPVEKNALFVGQQKCRQVEIAFFSVSGREMHRRAEREERTHGLLLNVEIFS